MMKVWLPSDTSKYVHEWNLIELAHYDFVKGRVLRDMVGEHQPLLVGVDYIEEFRKKYNNTGIYTSVFRYNSKDLDRATRLGSLYFDLDSDDGEASRVETIQLVEHLLQYADPEAVRIFFTGKKGFHVEVEAYAIGLVGSKDLPEVFRLIANDIKDRLTLNTIDFQVYDLRRIWRLPNSRHQDTELFKRDVSMEDLLEGLDHIKHLAQEPSDAVVPDQKFSIKTNEWYREYVYKLEESKKPKQSFMSMIENFERNGSTGVRSFDDSDLVFNPDLFIHCPSVGDLWKKAEEKHHLEHEERLFLCSLLTYTDEAIWYLHQILSQCDDYYYEKTESHIRDWVRRREMGIGGRPYTCRRAADAGIGCGGCNLEPRKKYERVNGSFVETGEYSEPSPIRFAYVKRGKLDVDSEESQGLWEAWDET